MAAGPPYDAAVESRSDTRDPYGRIVHPDGIVDASVAIRDGRILVIGADAMPAATETAPRNCGRLAEAKARGVDLTGKTRPHYLFLSSQDYQRCGGVIRVNPPVREVRNQAPL